MKGLEVTIRGLKGIVISDPYFIDHIGTHVVIMDAFYNLHVAHVPSLSVLNGKEYLNDITKE